VLRAAGLKEEVAEVERRKAREADLAAEAMVKKTQEIRDYVGGGKGINNQPNHCRCR
jgi:hypothetical protein